MGDVPQETRVPAAEPAVHVLGICVVPPRISQMKMKCWSLNEENWKPDDDITRLKVPERVLEGLLHFGGMW